LKCSFAAGFIQINEEKRIKLKRQTKTSDQKQRASDSLKEEVKKNVAEVREQENVN